MREIIIFGKPYKIIEQKSNKDSVELKENKIIINKHKRTTRSLLKEFLAKLLYNKLVEIYDELRSENKVEILGDIDFKVVGCIDKKATKLAKIKDNKILVRLNNVVLPKSALKYVVTHEITHIFTKSHNEYFWKLLKIIYPNFLEGKLQLEKYEDILRNKLL